MKNTNEKLKKFENYIEDILLCNEYMKLKDFNHHWEYSIFDHCVNVAYYSYIVARFLKLDYISTVRAGMLHDFFLYNWKTDSPKDKLHGFEHPKTAYSNSIKHFEINDREKDIILKHMFPLTPTLPRYPESLIVSTVDKFCATSETLHSIFFRFKMWLIHDKEKINIPQFIYSFMYIFLIIKL